MSLSRSLFYLFFFSLQVNSRIDSFNVYDVIQIQLKTSFTYFTLYVYAFDEAMISVTCNITIYGDLVKDSGLSLSRGLYFENLLAKESGIINFTVTGSTSHDTKSFVYHIQDPQEYISIDLPRNIRSETNFFSEIEVTNQHGQVLIMNKTLTINDSIKEYLVSITNGTFEIQLYYPEGGDYSLSVQSSNANKAVENFHVKGYKMNISIDDQQNLNSYVQHIISIYFDEQNYYGNGTLILECIKYCSGTKFKLLGSDDDISDSKVLFSIYGERHSFNLLILSSGIFRWKATSEGFTGVITKKFRVNDTVVSIYSYFGKGFGYKHTTSPYLPVIYTIEVYGKDNYLYKDLINITILDKTSSSSIAKSEITIERGYKILEMYFKVVKESVIFRIVCNEFPHAEIYSEEITVSPNKINIYYEDEWIPKYSTESFKFIISIIDHNGFIEDTHGVYNVNIELYHSNSELEGSDQKTTTKNGEIYIDDLYVKSGGYIKFIIKCETCEDYYTNRFKIISGECEFLAIILYCLGVLISLLILCAMAFYLIDKNVEEEKYLENPYRILIFHPLISLCFKKPKNIRLMNSLQLFTSEINLLMAVGVMYFYYDTPTKVDDEDFDSDQADIGATGWAFAILLSIIMFIFKIYSILTPDLRRYYYIVCTVITLLDCAAIIYMSLNYCKKTIESWAKNFYIFFVIDIILIQNCLSILAIFFTKFDLKIPKQITIEIEIENDGIYRIDENNNPIVETPGRD